MPARPLSLLPALVLLGCAHAGGGARGEEVLERGGELADVRAEHATVTVTPDTITVWGMTEVPDGSRMHVAYAGVDAITRSELLRALQVRVASVVTDVDSTDASRRSLTVETMEVVDGVLTHGGALPHGWARIRRGSEVAIRIWARLAVPRATLDTAVRSLIESRGQTYSASFLDGLTLAGTAQSPAP